jgi:hypothetical protein
MFGTPKNILEAVILVIMGAFLGIIFMRWLMPSSESTSMADTSQSKASVAARRTTEALKYPNMVGVECLDGIQYWLRFGGGIAVRIDSRDLRPMQCGR